MELPNTKWHEIILADTIRSQIDNNFEECSESATELAEGIDPESFETPEAIALSIGTTVYSLNRDHFKPVLDRNIGENEISRDFVKSYIGIQTIREVES